MICSVLNVSNVLWMFSVRSKRRLSGTDDGSSSTASAAATSAGSVSPVNSGESSNCVICQRCPDHSLPCCLANQAILTVYAMLYGGSPCAMCPIGKFSSATENECRPCPLHSSTLGKGSTRKGDCICDSGYAKDDVTQQCQLADSCEAAETRPNCDEGSLPRWQCFCGFGLWRRESCSQ